MWLTSGWFVWLMLATMFRCDNDTPLDRPVVPLEYGMNATSTFDRLFFRIEVSTIGSSISSKSHAPLGLWPLPFTDMMYKGFTPGPSISFCASRTLGNNSGIVTTPTAPESLNWWASSTEKKIVTYCYSTQWLAEMFNIEKSIQC